MCVPQGELLPVSGLVLSKVTGLYCWERQTLIVETEAEVSVWSHGEVDGLPSQEVEAMISVSTDAIKGLMEAKSASYHQRIATICAERWPDIQPERKL
jgi:hypothetical protein